MRSWMGKLSNSPKSECSQEVILENSNKGLREVKTSSPLASSNHNKMMDRSSNKTQENRFRTRTTTIVIFEIESHRKIQLNECFYGSINAYPLCDTHRCSAHLEFPSHRMLSKWRRRSLAWPLVAPSHSTHILAFRGMSVGIKAVRKRQRHRLRSSQALYGFQISFYWHSLLSSIHTKYREWVTRTESMVALSMTASKEA